MSYATLVPMGLYEWPWRYSAKTIAKDVSYHLVYGAGTALDAGAGRFCSSVAEPASP